MRADVFFKDKFGSRTKAAEAIEKGWVLVNGKPIKPKADVCENDTIEFVLPSESFVSNGGYKLSKGLKAFNYNCNGKICVDIGASTGGFTDCLLQNGVKKVYAVDVGESLLHDSIKSRKEIVVMDNCNARYLTKTDFEDEIDLVVTDVSFISLKLIFPSISNILSEQGDAIVLIKPQFECENKNIGKSGIVQLSSHPKIVQKVLSFAVENGLYPRALAYAPIRKGKNVEYVVWLIKDSKNTLEITKIPDFVKEMVQEISLQKTEITD